MSRKWEGSIRESYVELQELARKHRGKPEEKQIEVLRSLLQNSSITLMQIAERVGCSERTVRRWLKRYEGEGIVGLLAGSKGESEKRGMATYDLSRTLRDFLNALPVTDHAIDWIGGIREALMRLFGDVDRISININLHCDLHDPQSYQTDLFVTQHIVDTRTRRRGAVVTTQLRDKVPGELLLDGFRRERFPLHEYHTPYFRDYYVQGKAYVGTIILWRERRKKPISSRTYDLMEDLDPFLIFLLSDCVARCRRDGPDLQLFSDIVTAVGREIDLTMREMQVFLHHILGESYGEIASQLSITIDTVRKHVKSIHRKSGARTYTELFARYFTPLREP